MKNNIAKIRKASGITQADLATRLGIHVTNLNRIEVGKSAPNTSRLSQIAEQLGVTIQDLIQVAEVPLVGRVGAGQSIEAIHNGDADYVTAPTGATSQTEAVLVTGDSAYPMFSDGDLLFYSNRLPPEAMVNQRCIIQLTDGRAYLKILRKGSVPGLWTLQSINTQYPDVTDVSVDWVAKIIWTRLK